MTKYSFEIGKNYLIRTVTMIDIGEVVEDFDDFVILTKASWIADTGRFMQAMTSGTFNEVEPFPAEARVLVSKSSIIDALQVTFPLPTAQK
jgi:hypothetical protein